MLEIPRYAELLQRTDAPAGSAWGIFGADDRVGTLNFIGAEQILAAAASVKDGRVFSLNLPLELPDPGFFHRSPPHQTIVRSNHGAIVDDYLDRLYPQSSSHWDALRHSAHPEHGFFNAVSREVALDATSADLGVHHWARRGIVARGVLIDFPRAFDDRACSIDPLGYLEITADVLAAALNAQEVTLCQGDILLLRTGWLAAYLAMTRNQRVAIAAEEPAHPGLHGTDVVEFLWDHRIAAVVADNPALEAARPGTGIDLALHQQLIALLGMPLGELWDLEELAADCAEDHRYTFLLTSSPLNVRGGAGSPANAIAVK
jgi:kynurenine formamidase